MPAFFETGFSVRKPMWHGLGTILEEYPGREEAMQIAGHDFTIEEQPIALPAGEAWEEIPGWKALKRSDTGDILHVTRDTYEPLQNERLWDIADAIIGEDNVQYETAGVLKAGAVLWVLARINKPSVVKGDNSETYPYALVSTTHDGTGACKARAVSVRVVCWNTYSAADAEAGRSGRQFTFRHTKRVMDRIEDAKAALGLIQHQHEEFIHLANDLADIKIERSGVVDFLTRFIPEPRADVISERQRKNIEEAREQVKQILDLSSTIPEAHRRTAYGLWSAGIEYLDYMKRAHNEESRFHRTMLDRSKMKRKLMKIVAEVA